MKFDVNLQDIRIGLNIVKDTIGTSQLGHEGLRIYASKKSNRIKITTNGGSGYYTETWINASVKEGGKAIVPAKKFIQYISKLDGDKISISELKAGQITVKSKRGQQSFNRYDDATWIDIPKYETKDSFTIPGRTYKQLINGVAFAAQEDKNRPILEGININSNGKEIELTTTNGVSVAHFKKKIKAPIMNITIEKKSLVNASRIVKDDERITFYLCNETHVILKVGDTSYHMPLLAGTFPNLSKIIPQDDFSLEVSFEKEEILGMLDRASAMLDTKGVLHFENDKLMLIGESEYGKFEEFIMANMQGTASDIRLDIRQLMDIIKHVDAEEIIIGVRERKPLTIRPNSKAQQTCLLTIAG